MTRKKLLINLFVSILLLFHARTFIYSEENYPRRIISLGPAVTEGLYLLGVEDKIVGVTVYCQRPEEAKGKEKVGTVTEANIEKIVALKPDLVIATALTDIRQIKKLKSLGLTVVTPFSYKDKNFPEMCESFINLGRTVGREEKAKEIVYKAKKKVASIQGRIKGLSRPRVVVQIGTRPLWIATKDSFINDFIKLAGGINIGPSGKNGLYSREKILKQNPDVIIIVTMGIIGEEEKKFWQKFETINAVKNNRVYIVDSYKVCSPTPESFVDALEEIVKIIHPEYK
ncbi:MAG: hypothetical protein AMJ78_05260 [Omnitrophica WOR_2 bacterium SM23_29]|nr:MAG: hypothetical protein AMJ78_05260 [Omnitrophica WOR_2 bacterium SM23_29]